MLYLQHLRSSPTLQEQKTFVVREDSECNNIMMQNWFYRFRKLCFQFEDMGGITSIYGPESGYCYEMRECKHEKML